MTATGPPWPEIVPTATDSRAAARRCSDRSRANANPARLWLKVVGSTWISRLRPTHTEGSCDTLDFVHQHAVDLPVQQRTRRSPRGETGIRGRGSHVLHPAACPDGRHGRDKTIFLRCLAGSVEALSEMCHGPPVTSSRRDASYR